MNNIINKKKLFENAVSMGIGRKLKLTQSQSLHVCRQSALNICQCYEDGISANDTVQYVIAQIADVDELKKSIPQVFTGWR
jgi:hypothetical protein